MHTIEFVPKEQIDECWSISKEHIESALKHCNEIAIQDVYRDLINGSMGLLIIRNPEIYTSVAVRFMDYPQIRALRVVALGGEKTEEWLPALHQFLEMWGIENGVDRVEMMGRKGWIKKLKPFGWKESYIFATKDLDNG